MIPLATKRAKQSEFKYKVGAVLTKGGRVISTGFNKVGHRSHYRKWDSVHAEEQAIYNLLKHGRIESLAGSTLYVSRVLNNGDTAMARPCNQCYQLALSVGVSRIVYTTGSGLTNEEKL